MWWGLRAYRASHQRVLALHGPMEVEGLAVECAEGRCSHGEDDDTASWDDCPTTKITVCSQCFILRHPDGMFDDLLEAEVLYPCATFRAAVTA